MNEPLYELLTDLTARLERAGLPVIGSFSWNELCVVVDFWHSDGELGHLTLPMPFAVMPSVMARRIQAARP